MGKLSAVISCLLLIVGAANAQSDQRKANERPLPQWLTGLIAVAGFLFLSFVGFLVKKAWCEGSRRKETSVESERENDFALSNGNTYETGLDAVRSKEQSDTNAYDNLVFDSTGDRVTSM